MTDNFMAFFFGAFGALCVVGSFVLGIASCPRPADTPPRILSSTRGKSTILDSAVYPDE